METYICENVFVPLRSGPSHKSEMLSQVLFGEKFTMIDKAGKWMKVETVFDRYQGWIDGDHAQHTLYAGQETGMVLNKTLSCFKPDKTRLTLEPGCEIFNPDFGKKVFTLGRTVYTAPDDFSEGYISTREALTDTALRFINSPYIWGGRIPSGIDCSGLCQLVYKIHSIAIPRDSRDQAETGTPVDFIDQAKPGDLVFFDNEQGRISHVGMILAEGLVIHASGHVRIDTIDHQGIFKKEINNYSHRLRMIKRIT